MDSLTADEYAKENGFCDYESMIRYIDIEKKATESLSFRANAEYGLIEFFDNGHLISSWNYEDEDDSFSEFKKVYLAGFFCSERKAKALAISENRDYE